ncbi:histidine kinase N-terminal 7TM domain-containing protein [Halovenus sp. HT40]|uniref:histidine kinase N-terminal 7TM domain-containing protein n=1 Tax=Halovenus sp. HT40 TaxID=3126691 RepID=UPI00300F06F6
MSTAGLQVEPVAVGYIGAFAVSGLACLIGLSRAREVEADAVRRGLVGLLTTTSVWALLKVVYFVAPDPIRQTAYIVGLVFGFATVWAWLYFCSAYTGRSYHEDPTLRALGGGFFAAVVGVKLTNPIHGLYFETSVQVEPFNYLAIEHGIFHWTVTGLSYVMAGIGIFMLFELYHNSGYDTRPLGILTVFLALPVTFDIISFFTDAVIEVIYAPLGVAMFVLGVLFIYERRFLAVQSAGEDDDAVIFLDEDSQIRDYSPAAQEFFPALADARGEPLESILPRVAEMTGQETQTLECEIDGETRYLLTSTSSVTLGDSQGQVLFFSDITTAEQRRRELERHNEQLEGFASALAHELRNMLQIIEWRLGIAQDRTEEGTVENESIEKAMGANERLTARVDDFTTLAKYGQTVERLEAVGFETAVDDAWWNAETGEMELTLQNNGTIDADPGRLRELLGNIFVFNRLNGADTVTVELSDAGFAVAGNGEPPGEDVAGYLAFGESVPTAEAGMKLPNAKTFARVHGWEIDIDTDHQEGVRVVVSEARTEVTEQPPEAQTD